jgi:thioredoxin reductase (NADPH)
MHESSTVFDLIVLGSGPSGLTAALYASRAFLNVLVIAGESAGGQLAMTSDVENFPGFPEGVTGSDLVSNMRKQAEKYGAKFIDENAKQVTGSFEENFSVQTVSGNVYLSKSVIIATGASARWLGIESEQKLIGKGVSACATCDGFFFKDKVIAVVGGGDSAMEEATFLTRFASKIYVLVRKSKEELRASKIMQKKAFENPKIEFLFNTQIKEVLGENFVEGLKISTKVIEDGVEVEKENVLDDIRGVFVAIGHKPNTEFLNDFVELDEKGYVKVFGGCKTSKEGVFVSGDVHDHVYKQAISAAGFGCMAAIDAIKFLASRGVKTEVS